jgi:hypothetical protein
MSDDTLSSPPPSLPMATTTICCGWPCASRGSPWRAASAAWWKSSAADADLGQRAPGGGHLGQVGAARQVARGGDQPYALAQLPQTLMQRGFVGAGRLGQKRLHRLAGEGPVELCGHGFGQLRLRRQQAAAITGTAGNAVECGMAHAWIRLNEAADLN